MTLRIINNLQVLERYHKCSSRAFEQIAKHRYKHDFVLDIEKVKKNNTKLAILREVRNYTTSQIIKRNGFNESYFHTQMRQLKKRSCIRKTCPGRYVLTRKGKWLYAIWNMDSDSDKKKPVMSDEEFGELIETISCKSEDLGAMAMLTDEEMKS